MSQFNNKTNRLHRKMTVLNQLKKFWKIYKKNLYNQPHGVNKKVQPDSLS
jgi:signal recognition particle GTPase